jgi:hypothetical protein
MKAKGMRVDGLSREWYEELILEGKNKSNPMTIWRREFNKVTVSEVVKQVMIHPYKRVWNNISEGELVRGTSRLRFDMSDVENSRKEWMDHLLRKREKKEESRGFNERQLSAMFFDGYENIRTPVTTIKILELQLRKLKQVGKLQRLLNCCKTSREFVDSLFIYEPDKFDDMAADIIFNIANKYAERN